MKKMLISIYSLLISITLLSQSNPTYEQTVNYIIENTKGRVMYPGDLDAYSRVEGYFLSEVKIEKNGKIELITYQQNKINGYKNNFNITFNIFDLVEKTDYPDGIRAYKYLVHFNGLNVSNGYGIAFATDADAIKVARAFRHLKTLCTRDNDLFSQITPEEKKPKLSKTETIEYINKKLTALENQNLETYTKFKVTKNSIKVKDCLIEYTCIYDLPYNHYNKECHAPESRVTYYKFNIKDIDSVKFRIYDNTTGKGHIMIYTSRNSVDYHTFDNLCRESRTVDTKGFIRSSYYLEKDELNERRRKDWQVTIEFPNSDPSNSKKLIRAFERLRELCKEGDDPFGD